MIKRIFCLFFLLFALASVEVDAKGKKKDEVAFLRLLVRSCQLTGTRSDTRLAQIWVEGGHNGQKGRVWSRSGKNARRFLVYWQRKFKVNPKTLRGGGAGEFFFGQFMPTTAAEILGLRISRGRVIYDPRRDEVARILRRKGPHNPYDTLTHLVMMGVYCNKASKGKGERAGLIGYNAGPGNFKSVPGRRYAKKVSDRKPAARQVLRRYSLWQVQERGFLGKFWRFITFRGWN